MKALHFREVEELVIHRLAMLAMLAKTQRRSMQAELRTILEGAVESVREQLTKAGIRP